MNTIPQQLLTPQQRHTLLMLYSVRLFYPDERPTISQMADALDISRGNLIWRLNVLRGQGYIKGGWMRCEFVPVAWGDVV